MNVALPRWRAGLFVLGLHAGALTWATHGAPCPAFEPRAAVDATLWVRLVSEPRAGTAAVAPPGPRMITPPRASLAMHAAPAVSPAALPLPLPLAFAPAAGPDQPAPGAAVLAVVDGDAPSPPAAVSTVAAPAVPQPLALPHELALVCPQRTPPVYPPEASRTQEEGVVQLRVELGEDGRITEVRVQRSSGRSRLDDAALMAVRNWRCDPPRLDGRALRAVGLQTIRFTLPVR